jgi:glycosyltransferase involved in cell wall biosynthesis
MAASPREITAPRFVSVIIPVRNGAETIAEQLDALSRQSYPGAWEVLVADNGSTDRTKTIVEAFEPRLPSLRVVDASDRAGSSYARNCGAAAAEGDFLAFCDADDVVSPDWLASLVAAAPAYDAVTGVQDAEPLNSPVVQTWRSKRAVGLPRAGYLPYAPSCNLGVWASVWAETGGFNEEYPQSHDVDWSWRAQLSSHSLGFAPGAVVQYRYRTSVRGIARQAYASGVDSARLYRDFRDKGMRPRPLRRMLHTWAWLVVRCPYLLSADKRPIWVRRGGEAAGRLSGSVRFRILFL